MESVISDLRFVLRSWRRSRLFVVVAVLSLGLGIGANTAIFSLMDQVLLRALPVKEPDRLVQLQWNGDFNGMRFGGNSPFSFPEYNAFRDSTSEVFEGVAAYFETPVDVGWSGVAQRSQGALVSGNYFSVLGVPMTIGHGFKESDDSVKNGAPYAVLSYNYWQSRFASDPSVLNRAVHINGQPFTITGVASRGFAGTDIGSPADIFVPVVMKPGITPTWDKLEDRSSIWLQLLARMRRGVSRKRAAAAATLVYRREQLKDLKVLPDASSTFRAQYLRNSFTLSDATRGVSDFRDTFSTPLIVLMSMVGTLLLIACGNVANLLVARATARSREIAIRLSIGATKGAIVRLVMVESMLLSAIGAGLGLMLACWSGSLLVQVLPSQNGTEILSTTPDARVLLFTLGLSALTALIFGAVPALQTTRTDVGPVLKSEVAAIIAGGHELLRKGLVAAQISLSLLLLLGTGLFARSLHNLMAVNPGMATRNVISFSIDPSLSKYSATRSRTAFETLQRQLRTKPGIEAVSSSENPVLAQAAWTISLRAENHISGEEEHSNAITNAVLPGFFSTLQIPLLGGRDFTEADRIGTPKVAIVNQEFAEVFFSGRSPVGRHFGFGSPKNAKLDILIVGLVKNSKSLDLKEKLQPYVYTALLQNEHPGTATFYLRTPENPKVAIDSVRRAVRHFDPNLPVYDAKSIQIQIDETHYIERLLFLLSTAFALLATFLAAFGLYGVMSYAVTRRTRDIGVRMALGAQRSTVLGMIMREVVLVTALGTAVALPIALSLSHMLKEQLFHVEPNDPLTMALSTGLLVCVGLAAGLLPAMYASRIDPIQALRWE